MGNTVRQLNRKEMEAWLRQRRATFKQAPNGAIAAAAGSSTPRLYSESSTVGAARHHLAPQDAFSSLPPAAALLGELSPGVPFRSSAATLQPSQPPELASQESSFEIFLKTAAAEAVAGNTSGAMHDGSLELLADLEAVERKRLQERQQHTRQLDELRADMAHLTRQLEESELRRRELEDKHSTLQRSYRQLQQSQESDRNASIMFSSTFRESPPHRPMLDTLQRLQREHQEAAENHKSALAERDAQIAELRTALHAQQQQVGDGEDSSCDGPYFALIA